MGSGQYKGGFWLEQEHVVCSCVSHVTTIKIDSLIHIYTMLDSSSRKRIRPTPLKPSAIMSDCSL